MINRIIEWSLHNRFLILLATFFLVVLGIYSLKKISVDAIPDLSDVQVIIKTPYPGQAPQVVEDQVTYPLTTAMLAVPGVITVRAFSFFGDSYVYVIFQDGTNLYWARSRVLEYLNQISSKLPANAKPELGPDATGVGWIYQYALIDKSGKHDLSQLTSLQNWLLKYELQTIPGVAEIATVGGMVKQYQIVLEPNQIRAYGLSLSQIIRTIQQSNSEVGGSVVEMGEGEYMVRTDGYIQNIEALKNIPIGITKNGTPILLSNVARINLGPQMRRGIAELNGKGEAVGGIVVMRMGENALTTIEAVKAKLLQIQKNLPKGVKIITVYDRSGLIQRAISALQSKLIEEILIVILVCFAFLFHFRSSLVIVISLPIGILVAFMIMYWQGINANIMSLGGIAIAIGAMVDAAIVMIENVHKHIEKTPMTRENRWQIIHTATLEVGAPIFFTLLIITLSFLPVFALQAQEGRLFTPLAYTKTYAMAAAAGLSITLVPVLMGYFIRGTIIPEQKNPINRILIACYRPVVTFILRIPKTVLLIAVLVMITSYWPLSHLGSEFMPDFDEGDWMYMPTTLPGISIGQARQILQQTDKNIKTFPEVKTVFGKIGRASTATDPAPLTMIETIIQLKPRSEWPEGMTPEQLKEKFNEALNFPGMTNAWVMPIKTRIDMLSTGIKTPIGIKISGPNLVEIQKISTQIESILKGVPGTASVYADRAVGGRYINIDIKRKSAARYGLTIKDIQDVISTAIGGANIAETIEGRERYPINVRYPQTERDSLEKIKFLPLVTPTGAHIPLMDVANIYIADGPPIIKSENAQLTSWILIDIHNIDIGTYISRAKNTLAERLKLPVGYTITWSGQFEYMQRATQRLLLVVPLALAIIIVLLFIIFQRIREVLIILLTLPLAFTGGFWLLYCLQYNLSVAVGVGFIALAGIAVEIGVIMLIYLNQAWQKNVILAKENNVKIGIEELKKTIMEGSVLRIRPIMMTVATIVFGLLPIMFSSETGTEVMRRIAAPMVGGIISACLLALIVIPVIYYLVKLPKISSPK